MLSESMMLAACSWLVFALLAALCYWIWQDPATRQVGWWKALSRPNSAERRARALLREMLSAAEYQQWQRCGYLEVQSPTYPQRVYRIPGTGGRVRVFEHGDETMQLCLQPVDPLPVSDLVVLHKLLIESDERAYLARANHLAASRAVGLRRVP